METLTDILLNLEPGCRVEFSRPFKFESDKVMIRCKKDNLVKDILMNKMDTKYLYISAEENLVEIIKQGLAILNKEKPLPLDNSNQPWYSNPYID